MATNLNVHMDDEQPGDKNDGYEAGDPARNDQRGNDRNKEPDEFADEDASDEAPEYSGLPLFRGLEVDAVYTSQIVPSYKGNPCIEALTPEFATDREAAKALLQAPEDFSPEIRNWSTRDRIHCLGDLEDSFFQPLAHHLTLQAKISRMIRRGYVKRNPTVRGFYKQLRHDVDAMPKFVDLARENRHLMRRPKAHGFHLIGPSGIGKSYSLESILFLYPQVIRHREYNGERFPLRQLVWLKLDCPYDGLLKGLAYNFLEAVDDILGTTYTRGYTGRISVDDLLRGMAHIAGMHCLGALIIDEIQMLKAMRGENPVRMLNFFVNLANTIGVPVLLAGTDRARQLFSQRPPQARRGTGQGSEIWYLMRKDGQWRLFLESLFRFQYIRKPVALTQELSDALFEHSQGITDIVVKLFVHVQIRAMMTEDEQASETITPAIVRSVAVDSFQMLRPVINALRRGDRNALLQLEDIYPHWLEEYTKITQQAQDAVAMQSLRAAGEGAKTLDAMPNSEDSASSTKPVEAEDASKQTTRRRSRRQERANPPGSLMAIVEEKKSKLSAYQALQQAKLTFSLEHYLKEEAYNALSSPISYIP